MAGQYNTRSTVAPKYNLFSCHPNILARCPNILARHPNILARHPNILARHPNILARHPNILARHLNFSSQNVFLSEKKLGVPSEGIWGAQPRDLYFGATVQVMVGLGGGGEILYADSTKGLVEVGRGGGEAGGGKQVITNQIQSGEGCISWSLAL